MSVEVYVRYSCFIPSHVLGQVLIIFMSISPFSLARLVLGSPGWCTIANCLDLLLKFAGATSITSRYIDLYHITL